MTPPKLFTPGMVWTPSAIPRIIHQTFSTRDLPADLARNVAILREANPDHEYRFYDGEAREALILAEYGPAMLSRYRRISPAYGAARADLFRYLTLYRFGGIYLDVKSGFARPIAEVLRGDEHYVIARWRNALGEVHATYGLHPELAHLPRGEIQQWHVIAAPGHPFLAAVIDKVSSEIDRYRPWRDGVGKHAVLRITGPIAYTLAIEPLLPVYPCTVLNSEADISLRYSFLHDQEHVKAFSGHYSREETLLITPIGLYAAINSVYQIMRKLKRVMRRSRQPASILLKASDKVK